MQVSLTKQHEFTYIVEYKYFQANESFTSFKPISTFFFPSVTSPYS